MKMKKFIASVAAAAMAVSSMAAISASAVTAGGTTLDFEDGDSSFVYLNLDDSGCDNSVVSVEEYNGSKKLKIDVQDKTKTPKVWFDLDKIMDRANTVQIAKIEIDITIAPKSADGVVGWVGGAVGAAGGFDMNLPGKGQENPGWSQQAWDGGAYNPGEAAEVHVTKKFIMGNEKYTTDGINPFFGIMEWGGGNRESDWVMYVDNIQFLDKSGNALALGVTEAAPAETEAEPAETEAAPAETEAAPAEDTTEEAPADEAAPAETEAAPAETEAAPAETAPAADTTTAPVATGNVAVASIAAVMAVAGAAAIVAKKRK